MIIRAGVLALFIAIGTGPACCADPALDVIPVEVTARTLPKGAPVEIDVRLKAGDGELRGISLSTFSNDDIAAEFAKDTPADLATLPPNSEHSWRLRLSRSTGSVLTDSILHIRAEFDVVPKAGGGSSNPPHTPDGSASSTAPADGVSTAAPSAPFHQLLYATAKVKPLAVVAAVELARAEIKGLPESLAHERPGRMFVLVTNQYSSPLTVKSVKPLGPTYVRLIEPGSTDGASGQKPQTGLPLRIGPGQTEAIAYDIEPRSQVVPGKYSFIAEVDIETDDKLAAAVLTPAQDINVVVLGESDLFKFLGIPSLLFLPGVLMLITWQFLSLMGKSDDEAKKYRPQWNTSDFWVIAVALSLLTGLAYPWLTGLVLRTSRDFVSAYGLADYAFIFGFALLATIVAFGLKRFVTVSWSAWRSRRRAQTLPSTNDTPLQILEKLSRLQPRMDNLFQQYAAGDNQAAHLLRLEPWSTDAEAWFVPRADIAVLDQNDADAIDQRDRLVNQPPPDVATVLTRLKDGIRNNWWGEPSWRPAGDVRHPLKVPPTGWTRSGRMVPLLQGD